MTFNNYFLSHYINWSDLTNNSSFNHDDGMISITHVSVGFFEVDYFLIIPFQVVCKHK